MDNQGSFIRKRSEGVPGAALPTGARGRASDQLPREAGPDPSTEYETKGRPIEPEGRTFRPSLFKWFVFLLIVMYGLITFYRVPILRQAAVFLVREDPVKSADLIVCLAGKPLERGLAAADLYREGRAPRVLLTRERPPDGLEALSRKDRNYLETIDLLEMVLENSGVPSTAWLEGEKIVLSTYDEAMLVREICRKGGCRSVIVVTSPAHTRRAGLLFRRALADTDAEVMVVGSAYSGFRPEDWWKTPGYSEEVVLEYLKLLYDGAKHLW